MSVARARRALGESCSAEYLYRGLRDGRFPGAKFGRIRVLRRDFIDAFLAANAAGREVDFEEFAASWTSTNKTPAVAS